jgi:hypothetical protein
MNTNIDLSLGLLGLVRQRCLPASSKGTNYFTGYFFFKKCVFYTTTTYLLLRLEQKWCLSPGAPV